MFTNTFWAASGFGSYGAPATELKKYHLHPPAQASDEDAMQWRANRPSSAPDALSNSSRCADLGQAPVPHECCSKFFSK